MSDKNYPAQNEEPDEKQREYEEYKPMFMTKVIYFLIVLFFVFSVRCGVKQLLKPPYEVAGYTEPTVQQNVNNSSNSQTDNYNNEIKLKYTKEEVNDVGFVEGLKYTSTKGIENFCSDSGYVPTTFITAFRNRFIKTFTNADLRFEEICSEIGNEEKTSFYKILKDTAYNNLSSEYETYKTEYGMSKQEYCKIFDEHKDTIIQERIKQIKQYKPHMFLD